MVCCTQSVGLGSLVMLGEVMMLVLEVLFDLLCLAELVKERLMIFLVPLMLGSRELIPLDALPPVEMN